jgi:membrane protein
MSSLWWLGGLTWKDLGKRVWSEVQDDDVFGRAAQLAYYFLLALFPLLLFLTSVIGVILGSGTGLRHSLFNYLSQVLPGSASQLVDSTMYEVSDASGGGKITFGIIAALWTASNGMGAITQALNVAYDVKESRPWWKQRLTAAGLTVVLSVLIISALALVLYGGRIGDNVASRYGFGSSAARWGEVNSEIENAAAKAGAPDAKEKGKKAPIEKQEKGDLQKVRRGDSIVFGSSSRSIGMSASRRNR